jgi:hypothetical protein
MELYLHISVWLSGVRVDNCNCTIIGGGYKVNCEWMDGTFGLVKRFVLIELAAVRTAKPFVR